MAEELSLEEKKRYIFSNIKFITPQDRITIGDIFIQAGYKKYLKESSDGIRINLDNIPEHVIVKIYYHIGSKLPTGKK